MGSVTGQRFWSHLYDLSSFTITTATWTPNDLLLIVGLSNGSLMVIDENGLVVSKHNLKNDYILNLAYNCPKFTINFLNDNNNININNRAASSATSNANVNSNLSSSLTNLNNRLRISNNLQNVLNNNTNSSHHHHTHNTSDSRINSRVNNHNYMLACSFKSNGVIYLLKAYDDIDPIIIYTKLEGK